MMYPVYKTIHEEVVEGGWKALLSDMLVFCLKSFLFLSIAYVVMTLFGFTFAKKITESVSVECVQELGSAF
jgi:hypothetical protein